VQTLPAPEREAIIRQLVKGSVGGAALLWAFYNRDKVRDFFHNAPSYFEHTPIAMAFQEGSIIADIVAGRKGAVSDLQKMGRYDIPFTYTITDLAGALDPKNPNGWRDYLYSLLLSTAVPQAVSWTAKELDKPTPFDQFERPPYRVPQNIPQAIEQGVPGL